MSQIESALEKLNFGRKTTLYIREQTAGKGRIWIRYSEVKRSLPDAPSFDTVETLKKIDIERKMILVAQARDAWEADFFGGKLRKDDQPQAPKTLKELFELWIKGFTVPSTIRNNTSQVGKVLAVLGKNREADTLTRAHLEKVAAKLIDDSLHQNSQRYILKKFRTMLLWALDRKLIQGIPSFKNKIIPAEVREKRKFLTVDQINKIAKVEFKHRNVQDCFLFSCYTGARIGESRNLKWSEIDLENANYMRWQNKTKKNVAVPLSIQAVEILKRQVKTSSEKVFQVPVDQVFNRHFQKLLECAGVETDAKPTNARASFARALIQNHVEPEITMELLGQEDLRTTLGYYNEFDMKQKRKGLAKVEKVFK